ncbi:MAG: AAA family ATPase [Egibacteraceae bacterium]
MRLRSIRLAHFRGVEARTVRFATEGVTVVSGPNEAGKSSVLEALGLLFDTYDSSTRREVLATQPVGRDVGTEIDAEIEVGEAAFRYVKRFHRDRGTELIEHRPQARRHVGRQAHERALQLLGDGIDVELWRALRVQQGSGWQQASLAGQASLLAALGGARSAEDEDLAERAEREARRYRTAKRGEETGELRRVAVRHAGLCEERDALSDELARQAQELGRADALVVEEQRLVDALDQARARRQAAEWRLRELEDATREHARREAEAEAARRLAVDLSALAETVEALDVLRGQAEHAAAERQRLADAAAEAEARRDEAACAHDAARAEASQAAFVLGSLSQRVLAGPCVDAATLVRVRERHVLAREARAAAAASSARLELRALQESELSIDERPRRLRAGEALTQEVTARVVVRVADVEMTLDAGEDAATCAARREAAERALAEALASVGAESMEQAQDLHERYEQALRDRDRVRTLRASLGLVAGPADSELPPRDAAQAALETAMVTLADADVGRQTAEQTVQTAREALRGADEAGRMTSLRHEAAVARADELRERLGDAVPREDVARAAECAEREAALLAASSTDREEPFALVEQLGRCEQAQAAVDEHEEALRVCRSERLTLQGALQARGADGLFERAQRVSAECGDAQHRMRQVRRAADAAELLSRALDEARTEARSDYATPLRTATVELGRTVFGWDFDVELDEELRISHRVLHGLSLPFDQLSTGAQEQLAVLARLACAAVVGRGGGAPIILDDAFGYADPQRLAAVNEVLARAGSQAQVIVLTCDARRFHCIDGARYVELGGA